MGTDRLTEVLDATYDCLTRYGVRRTTMDDIASTIGVSRSAVYQYVRSKDDAFRRLAERLHTQALARARRAAAAEDAPYAERVRGILAAKLDLVLQLAGDSPHTAELLNEKARLFGDICHGFTGDLRRLLIDVFAEAGAPGGVEPAEPIEPVEPVEHVKSVEPVEPVEAADICIALVIGLESVAEGRRLLAPAADALMAGLLPTTAIAPH
ncbi:TetR/AcrR family transcriptional regulator [Streptomyces inhibens]|uniref:TetR/AcrR family transcriptional regulator n=1 Tax=Streptomyces inhibens TaxID=2293571 RepID=A0A371PVS9_STRIH|nr:TetR/AcrR family transcriptional regulator [Streptomyces inhibens]REK86253.1 TetR/AcrR family transcriptional regulator [Streptomyces inhibens]